MEGSPSPVGQAAPAELPGQMQTPAPTPMPASPMEQQPSNDAPFAAPEVERMQMPMQPIETAPQQAGVTMQMGVPQGGGNKKVIIIGVVVIVLLALGGGGFLAWRSMNQPVVETPVAEQPTTPITVPTSTETVVVPVAPQPDDISVIEQALDAFNIGGIDAEIEANLSEISKSL